MLGKRARPYRRHDLPPARRLRSNIADLFSSNVISGIRAQELFDDAADAGDETSAQLRSQGLQGHEARNLRRKLMKHNMWPDSYKASCTVWNKKLQQEESTTISFLLPHELLALIARVSDNDKIYDSAGLDPRSLDHLRACEAIAGTRLVGLGLWGDGAPCNWDRTDSIEVFTINLPGQTGEFKKIRILLTGISKKQVVTSKTFNDMMEVVSWSLRHLAIGLHPRTRHDGTPWATSDSKRQRNSGKPLGVRGALVEVRGDWKFLKECFGFPAWNTESGICWQCTCTPGTLRDVDADAAWRTERLTHWDVIHKIRLNGAPVSPLFSAPWVKTAIFRPDWLHAVDQGVAADFAGNVFWHLVKEGGLLPGNTQKERCKNLWMRVQEFYDANQVGDRLQNLTIGMLRGKSGAPKLRSSAAACRALVPFLRSLLSQAGLLDATNNVHTAMRAAAVELNECYQALSSNSIFWEDILRVSSRKFAAQYVALERAHLGENVWRVKPKMHLFLELCSDGSRPAMFWTYRDEDFGGSCAAWARRRGGLLRASATSENLLSRFKMKSSVPRLR